MKYFLEFSFFFILVFCLSSSQAQNTHINDVIPFNSNNHTHWVDSIMKTLSVDQKIAQLFMIAANSRESNELYYQKIDSLIMHYDLGGVIFFQSGPNELKNLLDRYNRVSNLPLLTSIDAEWGLGMRLDSVELFPWMMTLGAIQDDNAIYDFGFEVASQLKSLGVHINFAPVLDVNNNPNNPIINRRSFSSDVDIVSNKALAYMKGMQDNGVLACGKHFPGHGDTDVDSHKGLPVLNHDMERLDSLELKPFQYLIQRGLGGVMIAHMNLPLIDTLQIPSSFSSQIIKGLLKEKMAFKGLIISDALNMGALSEYTNPGTIELNAFLAGNDILLCPNQNNIMQSIELIKSVVTTQPMLMSQLNSSCKKILMTKKWAGAFNSRPVQHHKISLMTEESNYINHKLSKNAITVLKNKNNLIPLLDLDSLNIAYVSLGNDSGTVFYNRLNSYMPVERYSYNNHTDSLLNKLNSYDIVVLGLHYANNNFWERHVVSHQDSIFVSELCDKNKTIVNIFGHPKLLNSLPVDAADGIILSYQNSSYFQDLTAQLNFGSIGASGRLSVATNQFPVSSGLDIFAPRKFEFVMPLDVGMNLDSLNKIDSIVQLAIQDQVMPGCQIVVARHGKIFYSKSFGFHTYDSIESVQDFHLYDIASITKIAATAPILMNLVDKRLIKLKKKLKSYDFFTSNSDKKNIKIIDLLAHQAQLYPWIPFWQFYTGDNKSLQNPAFSDNFSQKYNLKVANNLFFNSNYIDSVYKIIFDYPLLEKKEYKYSDLGFYILQDLVASKLSMSIEDYLYNYVYAPIEAFRITYNPLNKFPLSHIIPTEDDRYFRHQLVRGYVHDQGAALFGGVALHAGLFSNAIDLMKLMQLYLDDGLYMGHSIIPSKRIRQFTTAHFEKYGNRRGLVFDKPSINSEEQGPTCDSISVRSFGHSGFTGTLSWVDPDKELIYIFLSNARVYPNGNNTKLLDQNIRTEIQKIIYQSLL